MPRREVAGLAWVWRGCPRSARALLSQPGLQACPSLPVAQRPGPPVPCSASIYLYLLLGLFFLDPLFSPLNSFAERAQKSATIYNPSQPQFLPLLDRVTRPSPGRRESQITHTHVGPPSRPESSFLPLGCVLPTCSPQMRSPVHTHSRGLCNRPISLYRPLCPPSRRLSPSPSPSAWICSSRDGTRAFESLGWNSFVDSLSIQNDPGPQDRSPAPSPSFFSHPSFLSFSSSRKLHYPAY